MIETRSTKTHERALLIGLEKQGVSKWDLQDSLEELAELATSAGAEVVDTVTQIATWPRTFTNCTDGSACEHACSR